MPRNASTYRAARRNAKRKGSAMGVFETPPVLPYVEGLLRGWLMRRHRTPNAPAAPAIRTGPSRHGKDILATHLNIAKARVREGARSSKTGISCEAGQTHKTAAHRAAKHKASMVRMRAEWEAKVDAAEVAALRRTREGIVT